MARYLDDARRSIASEDAYDLQRVPTHLLSNADKPRPFIVGLFIRFGVIDGAAP